MSLRKRKQERFDSNTQRYTSTNHVPSIDDLHQRNIHQQQAKLFRNNNNATGEDGDEEARQFEQIMLNHYAKSQSLSSSVINFLGCVLFIILVAYCVVIFYEPTEEPSIMHSIIKALSILLGLNKKEIFFANSSIVASTTSSASTEKFEEYLYPTWPWVRKAYTKENNIYIVPDTSEDEPIKQILHQVMKLKKDRGVSIDIFNEDMMRDFLIKFGHQCDITSSKFNSNHQTSNGMPFILQKFDEWKGMGSMNTNHMKNLWIWCMIYSGEAHGYLDIESYDIQLNYEFLKKLSLGSKPFGMENVIIETNEITDPILLEEGGNFVLSMSPFLFVRSKESKVAKGMLNFMLTSDDTMDDAILSKKLSILIKSQKDEDDEENKTENWFVLSPVCTRYDSFKSSTTSKPNKEINDKIMARICMQSSWPKDNMERGSYNICCTLSPK